MLFQEKINNNNLEFVGIREKSKEDGYNSFVKTTNLKYSFPFVSNQQMQSSYLSSNLQFWAEPFYYHFINSDKVSTKKQSTYILNKNYNYIWFPSTLRDIPMQRVLKIKDGELINLN